MRRVEVLDGLRGYFLVFMLLTHLSFAGGYFLVKVNHAQLGFVQDAQGFVFLSGLLVGALYGRRMLRQGFAEPARQLWRRAGLLYGYMIGSMAVIMILWSVLPNAGKYWGDWLGLLTNGTLIVKLAAGLMLYQPAFFDILPQYILYLLAAPPLLWLCVTGRGHWVLLGSALLWLSIQLGLELPLAGGVDALLARVEPDLTLRTAFNPFAWQMLFYSAMAIGVMWTDGRLDVGRLFDPRRPTPAVIAAVVCGFFFLWRLGFSFEVVPDTVSRRFEVFENRPEFSAVFLINFIAAGYLLTWLLVAGREAAPAWVRGTSATLHYVFGLPFLRLLGRHSLQVYTWHVIVVYMIGYIDGWLGPFREATKTAIALLAVASLSLPALAIEWQGRRRRATAAPALAAQPATIRERRRATVSAR